MSKLRVRPKATHGLVTEVTPESAGWTYVGFALHRLDAERKASPPKRGSARSVWCWSRARRSSRSTARISATIGERMSPFEGPPWAAYIPARWPLRGRSADAARTRRLLGAGRRGTSGES